MRISLQVFWADIKVTVQSMNFARLVYNWSANKVSRVQENHSDFV